MKNILSFHLFENAETAFDWQSFYDRRKGEDDWHQAILNEAYDIWQSQNTWGYGDMLNWVSNNMGEEAALLVQLGKYNQQVGNGGHLQYHDNRYDGSDGGGDDDMPLHQQLLEYMEKFNYNKSEIGKKIYDLAKSFQVIPTGEDCPECGGSGVIDEDDYEDDFEEYESIKNEGHTFSCGHCNGTGEDPESLHVLVRPHDIDDKYYKIDDEWLDELKIKAKDLVLSKMHQGLDAKDLGKIRSFF